MRCSTIIPCLLLAGSAIAADLAGVPADARWLAQIDLAVLRAGKLAGNVDELAKRPEIAERLDVLKEWTGTDVRRDLDRITLVGIDQREEHHLFIACGRFDAGRLDTLAGQLPQHRVIESGKFLVHRWVDEGKGNAVHAVHIDGRMLLLSQSLERVQAALAVLETKASIDPAAFGLAAAGKEPVLASLGASEPSAIAGGKPETAFLRQARAAGAAITEKDGNLVATVTIRATDEQAANRMRDLAVGAIAFGQLQQPVPHHPVLLALLDSATVTQNGTAVTATAYVPQRTAIDSVMRLLPTPPQPNQSW